MFRFVPLCTVNVANDLSLFSQEFFISVKIKNNPKAPDATEQLHTLYLQPLTLPVRK